MQALCPDCEDPGHEDYETFERLYEDLRTRLDRPDFDLEFANVPYEGVVRAIHRDLGLPEPVFGPQDEPRARRWNAQWADRQTPAPDTADPPPEPDLRYASG